MPIYEYECNSCAVRFERQQSVHDEPIKVCSDCGGSTKRIFHPVGIIFKGSGFYVTDNRKPSAPASSPSPSNNGESTSSASSSSSETKTESSEKAATKP